ncbi:MAG: hypothetical protein V2A54_01345 [Bacteroidota bacterium]
MKKIILLIPALLIMCFAYSQTKQLSIFIDPPGIKEYPNGTVKKFADSASMIMFVNKIQTEIWSQGFISAKFEIKDSAGKKCLFIHLGKAWSHFRMNTSHLESNLIEEFQNDFTESAKKPFNPFHLSKIIYRVLAFYENNGFPFAQLYMDSIAFNQDTLHTSLRVEKNEKITLDSMRIIGNVKISSGFLKRYLGLDFPSSYDESVMKNIDKRLSDLSFISVTRPSELVFTPGSCKLLIYADSKKNSSFDGIVGFRQNDKNKLQLTGEVRLDLINGLFRHGDQLTFNWRKFESASQDLKSSIVYPYVFNLPFGLDAKINLLKQDSTFLTINRQAGIRYIFNGQNYVKGFINYKTSDLINTAGMEFLTVLPPFADIRNTGYGLEWKIEKYDYRLNPSRGYAIKATGTAGERTIRKNPALNPLEYDSILLISNQYSISGMASVFIPVFRSFVLMNAFNYGKIIGKNLFSNELERIGGLQTLRGFDEESIYCSQFLIGTLEFRYILEQNSHLFLFYDQAYYENFSAGKSDHDTPLGFGAGIRFQTKAGIFTLSYALGKQYSNPIQFSTSKVHFGIASYF